MSARQLSKTVLIMVLMAVFFSGSVAMAQTAYPLVGHPQGGDRRGTYFDAKGRPDDKSIPLFKDPKMYIHNLNLIAEVPDVRYGQPQMMTIGDKRFILGGREIIDVTDPKKPVVVNRKAPRGQVAYNQNLKKWLIMEPVAGEGRDQDFLQKAKDWRDHPDLKKTWVGVIFYDMTDPRKPVEISRWQTTGIGIHSDGIYYDGGRYAYLRGSPEGTRGQWPFHIYAGILQIIDVSDINNIKEISRWWVPGQMMDEQKEFEAWPEAGPDWTLGAEWSKDLKYHQAMLHGPCIVPKRVEDGGTRGYCSWGAHGFITLDFSDIMKPKQVGRFDHSPPFDSGIPVHTAYPILERKLVFINPEDTHQDCGDGFSPPFIIDIRSEAHPVSIATIPLPKPPPEAPYTDFCYRGHRFGVHNAQEFKAPGEPRADLMAYTWFSGGFHLYDISNPFQPREIGWLLPPQGERRGTESVLIEWDRKLIHVFADSGLYVLSSPVLGEPILGPMKPRRWSAPGLNAAAP